MTDDHWEHFPHQADIGVRGIGASKDAAFAEAALALTAVIVDPARVEPAQPVTISCEAVDDETLLVDWLNALVYEMAVRRMLFSRFEVRIDANGLEATAWGEPLDIGRHQPAVEVKGATYTALRVVHDAEERWIAECVVDV